MPRICQPINVLKLTNVSIVRYRVGANTFELACYPNKVRDWREGIETDISQVLQSDRIFTCVNKGQFARDAELMGAFGSTNFDECVRIILSNGEVPLAAQERKLLQKNFMTEVYTIALSKIKPVEKGQFLHIDTLKKMTHEARVVPKMKKGLPPKACAALLVQNLVRAYPTQFGMAAIDITLEFSDVAVARKCYTEILKPSAAFGVREIPTARPAEETDATNPVPRTAVTIQCYISEDAETELKSYCELHNIKYETLRNVQMLSPSELEGKDALPAFLQTSTNANPVKDLDRSLEASQIFTHSSDYESFDSEELSSANRADALRDSDDEEERARKILLKCQRDRHEEQRLREKKIRSREREQREIAKMKELADAEARKLEEPKPQPPPELGNTDSPTWCKSCKVDFAEFLQQNIRQHTKMDWHIFNHKRYLRGQEPVTKDLFEALNRDIREGYLAVEN